MAKIAFIAPYASYYVNFSWDLLKTLVHDGYEVTAIAPDKDYESKFKSIGVQYREAPLTNTGINPFYDLYSIYILIKLLKKIKPDTVACFSIKPVLYGS